MILFKIAETSLLLLALLVLILIVLVSKCNDESKDAKESTACMVFGSLFLICLIVTLLASSAGLLMLIWR